MFSYEAVRDWEAKLTPALAEDLRGGEGARGPSWYVDETYIRVHGRWKYLYRAIDRDGALVDVMLTSTAISPRLRPSSDRQRLSPT